MTTEQTRAQRQSDTGTAHPVDRTNDAVRPRIETMPKALIAIAPSIIKALTRNFAGGTYEVTDATGGFTIGTGAPAVTVSVHDQRTYAAIVRYGSEGLAESYIAGWWDASDVTSFVQVLLRNIQGMIAIQDAIGNVTNGPLSLYRRLRPPSIETDRRNVQAHYDLSGELFELMLDETMSYSCAIFDDETTTLADAQRAKLDRLCSKLNLTERDHLLEIGTGWGGLAIHAASTYGCRVTTTTVSETQREVAATRVAEAGLSDRITVLGLDYRHVTGTFSKIVSVEMIEAVDWRRYGAFFSTLERLLEPTGLLAIQAITIRDRSFDRAKLHDDFIRRQVFPGGCLPSVTAIAQELTKATQLRIIDLDDIGRHYARTLELWRDRFEANWPTIEAFGFDETFKRLWSLYLSYCEAAFLERHISDVQLVIAGRDWRGSLERLKR